MSGSSAGLVAKFFRLARTIRSWGRYIHRFRSMCRVTRAFLLAGIVDLVAEGYKRPIPSCDRSRNLCLACSDYQEQVNLLTGGVNDVS